MTSNKSLEGQIEASPELEAITRRWMNALATRQGDICRALFSESDYLFYVGSDEDEVFDGSLLRDGYVDHVGALPKLTVHCQELRAYAHGETGFTYVIL